MAIVIKISGHELDDPAFLKQFAGAIRAMSGQALAIVHGGGKEISAMQTRMGIEPRYADGIRITDADSLALVEMVLCGTINKRLVRVLVNAGVDAVGMSGVDGGLVSAAKLKHGAIDMGFTGEVTAVRIDVLQDLLDLNLVPVIAPICLGDANNYNVNADHVAGAIGVAINAERLVFLSNVPGVMQDGAVISELTRAQSESLINDGVISGGMIPKVKTALDALASGVARVTITNLDGLQSGGGTTFTASVGA